MREPVMLVDLFLTATRDVDDPQLLAEYEALLTPEESARHRALVFERHRFEHLVTRALQRVALSRFRAIPPEAWRFAASEHGAPRIEPPSTLSFNLSNSPELVVCAVSDGHAIGVDVEPLSRAPTLLSLRANVFAPDELGFLDQLEESERAFAAVRLWTLKEAYLKGRGLGLRLPLDGFSFHFDRPAARITFTGSMADDPGRWQFRTVPFREHLVSIAVDAGNVPVEVRGWSSIPLRGERAIALEESTPARYG